MMMDLWDQYNKTRLAGDKKKATKMLLNFIALLKEKDKGHIEDFANDLCKKALDIDGILPNNGVKVSNDIDRIQHPIFKEIVLPILVEQYLEDSPMHIKWIGQLEQFFYSDKVTTENFLRQINVEGYFSTLHFLEKSFAIDPNQDTLSLLLKRQAQDIEYLVHELPWMVLTEPADFNLVLADFKDYLAKSEYKETWRTRLMEWENIAGHWAVYCARKTFYKDFIDYQEQNNIALA